MGSVGEWLVMHLLFENKREKYKLRRGWMDGWIDRACKRNKIFKCQDVMMCREEEDDEEEACSILPLTHETPRG